MDVILLERVAKLGHMGDVVKVKDGYARNFLLPTGKALRANEANRARFEAERAQLEARNDERKAEASTVAEKLDGMSFVVVRAAGETGQLYGSVAPRDIAEILAGEGFQVARNQIDLNTPIKSIGLSTVTIALHPEVAVTITLNIARSADEAERQARGEDLTSAEAIYGEEISEAARPEEFFTDEEAMFEEGVVPEIETGEEPGAEEAASEEPGIEEAPGEEAGDEQASGEEDEAKA